MTCTRPASRVCIMSRCSVTTMKASATPGSWRAIRSRARDRKSTRLNSSHSQISYAVFCLTRPTPRSTLFPYTTLFRSGVFVQVGMLNVELIQVLSAAPSAFHDMYASGEQGLHHVAMFCDDYESQRDAWELAGHPVASERSEEHTSELQSQSNLVCRLLLDTSNTEIYTLSLHDALPIWSVCSGWNAECRADPGIVGGAERLS